MSDHTDVDLILMVCLDKMMRLDKHKRPSTLQELRVAFPELRDHDGAYLERTLGDLVKKGWVLQEDNKNPFHYQLHDRGRRKLKQANEAMIEKIMRPVATLRITIQGPQGLSNLEAVKWSEHYRMVLNAAHQPGDKQECRVANEVDVGGGTIE